MTYQGCTYILVKKGAGQGRREGGGGDGAQINFVRLATTAIGFQTRDTVWSVEKTSLA